MNSIIPHVNIKRNYTQLNQLIRAIVVLSVLKEVHFIVDKASFTIHSSNCD